MQHALKFLDLEGLGLVAPAEVEPCGQEKSGNVWETFLRAAIWPWHEVSAEAAITSRGGPAQVWSLWPTERVSVVVRERSKVTQENQEWCLGAVNTSHLLLAARRSALSGISSSDFLLLGSPGAITAQQHGHYRSTAHTGVMAASHRSRAH